MGIELYHISTGMKRNYLFQTSMLQIKKKTIFKVNKANFAYLIKKEFFFSLTSNNFNCLKIPEQLTQR